MKRAIQIMLQAAGQRLQANLCRLEGLRFWLIKCASRDKLKTYSLQLVTCSLLFNFSCSAQRPSKPYYEDLSAYRPKLEPKVDTSTKILTPKVERKKIKPTKNVNAKVDAILDSIDRQNLQKKFVDGFTIQIYSGQKKEDAMTAQQKVVEELTDMNANLQYQQPKFRVTIGNYFSKLDAQKDLVRLKANFPGAILIPEKILIR